MAATSRAMPNSPLRKRGALTTPAVIKLVGAVIIFSLITFAVYLLMPQRSDVEKGTALLVEAFGKDRLIEPRLSGGFKGGEFRRSRDDALEINTAKLDRARDLIMEAVARGEATASLPYARLLLSEDKKLPQALKYLRQALADSPNNAQAYNDLGVCFIQQDKLEEAIEQFGAALERRPNMPEASFNRALCYQRLLLPDAAAAAFKQLTETERDPGWLNEIKHRLEEVSSPPLTQRSYAQVVEAFDAAMAGGRIPDARSLADQNPESIMRHAISDLSIQHLQSAVDGDQQKAESPLAGMELIGSVMSETRQDLLVADNARYLRSLPAADRASELQLLKSYAEAVTNFELNRVNDSKMTFDQLQARFRDRGNFVFEALSGFQLTNYYYSIKRFEDSVRIAKNVLSLVERREWPYYRARLINLLGLETSRLGQDSLAIKYFGQAISLCNKSPGLESSILQYMSIPYLRLGDLDAALARLRDSTRLYLQTGQQARLFENLAHNYSEIADIYRLRNQHALALLYAEKALNFADDAKNASYASEYSSLVAIEHARLDQYKEAEATLNRAFNYLDKIEPGRPHDFAEARVLTNGGEVAARSGDLPRALAYYDKAETLAARDEGSILPTIDVLRGRAGAYEVSGQSEKARSALMRAITLIENYRSRIANGSQRTHFLDASHSTFDQLISLDVQALSNPSEAFEMSERSRARELLEEIGRRQKPDEDRDVAFSSQGANDSRPSATRPLKLAEVQAQLPRDLTVLEYSVTSKGTYLFLITNSEFKVARSSATTEALDRDVRDYISDLRSVAPIEDVNEKARALYQLLIKPVEEHINGRINLCIIPDKALHFLPFAGLVDGSSNYLIDSHELTYAPSSSVLLQCVNKELKSRGKLERLLAVGDPSFNGDYFPNLLPLADAEREAKESASFYAPGSVALTAAQATEASVLRAMTDCDVAHLATHCLVEESSPWLAALVLSGATPSGKGLRAGYKSQRQSSDTDAGKDDAALANALPQQPTVDPTDGLLYLNELYKIRLPRTSLVVLSACQSGLGQYYRGEGMVSLVRPLLAAGVPTVVASLWPVDSRATCELMVGFHSQRKLADKPAGDALRDAQMKIKLSDRFRHPYYWAPFIVIGANK